MVAPLFRIDFEGLENDATLTSDIDNIAAVTLTGTGSATATTTSPLRGSVSGLLVGGTGTAWLSVREPDAINRSVSAFQMEFLLDALPSTAGTEIVRFRSDTGNSRLAIVVTENGAIRVQQQGGTYTYTSANEIVAAGVTYLLDVSCHRVNGLVYLRVTDLDTDLVSLNETVEGDYGGSGWDFFPVGSITGTSLTGLKVDSVAVVHGTTDFIEAAATQLDTPNVTVDATTNPTTSEAEDGTADVSWPAITGAGSYRVERASGLNATTGFTVVEESHATTSIQLTGLGEGDFTVGVTAKP